MFFQPNYSSDLIYELQRWTSYGKQEDTLVSTTEEIKII
jgi:hypothetical protein